MRRELIVEEESEASEAELAEMIDFLKERFPEHEVRVERLRRGSAFVRARDVAEAHLPLECVLCSTDELGIRKQLERLNGISQLMEKESRVTSWGMRTAYPPLIAAIAFLLVLAFPGDWNDVTSGSLGALARLASIFAVGGAFLYYGLKAVQLTKSATRLAKRIREYDFILTARKVQQGSCFDTGNELIPSGESEQRAVIRGLLADLDSDAGRISWFVANRVESAQVVLGQGSPSSNAMLEAVTRLCLDMADSMSAQVAARQEAIGGDDRSPAVVSERARLRERAEALSLKSARIRAYLGQDEALG